MRKSWTRILRRVAVTTLCALPCWTPRLVAAAPVTILGGYDHYAGALGQRTNSYLAGAAAGIGGGDLALVGMRYDDNQIGLGYGITGTAGLPIAPSIELRVLATRFIGDESFRAWRARVGPQFGLPGGGSLTLSYVHYEDNLPAHSNGVMGEASAPVTGGLTGRLSASCATSPQGPAALQGAVGLGWRPVSRLEISGEVGATRNGTGVAGGSFPGQHDLLGILPLGNGGGSTPGSSDPSREVAATALVGVRVFIP